MWRWLILSRPCIFSGLCLTNCLKICSKKLWINTRFSSCFLLLWSGLPDGLFSNQKSKFGYILEGLALKDVGIFNRHLVAFTVFRYILWTFGIVRGNLAYFFPFWYFVPRKIWQPWLIGCLCNFPISRQDDDNIDFDDLTRRFEALKKKKWQACAILFAS
jgi:hypothetical protein